MPGSPRARERLVQESRRREDAGPRAGLAEGEVRVERCGSGDSTVAVRGGTVAEADSRVRGDGAEGAAGDDGGGALYGNELSRAAVRSSSARDGEGRDARVR